MLRLGYVYPSGKLLRSSKNKLSAKKAISIGRENALSIADALEWNNEHGIKILKIPFETLPICSAPISWEEELDVEQQVIGNFISEHQMRLFMQPPPGASLSSPDPDVRKRAKESLTHAAATLNFFSTQTDSKIITTVGKVHKRRRETSKRFLASFRELEPQVQERAVVKNDALHWSFYEVFGLAGKLEIPVAFNYTAFLQNRFTELSAEDTVKISSMSWKKKDGAQKIYYSETLSGQKKKNNLSKNAFLKFYTELKDNPADIIIDSDAGGRAVLKAQQYIN